MAQQFLNRADVIAIHAEAQVRFDPPNQDIIVDQLTELGLHSCDNLLAHGAPNGRARLEVTAKLDTTCH
jgi:hypothetical protein